MKRHFLKTKIKGKFGVTLVESIISIFLTLLAFAILYQMFSFGYFRIKTVKHRLSAIHVCQEWLEETISLPYAMIEALGEQSSQVTIDYGPDANSDEDDLIGTRSVSFEDWVIEGELIGKRIIVTITWKWKNKNLSEKLVTAVSVYH